MKKILFSALILLTLASCTRDYFSDVEEDLESEAVDFKFIALAASADSVDMYEPVTLTAVAKGENLTYKWEKAKGSLAVDESSSNKARFWGCYTCFYWLTVRCTVSNESGSVSKEVNIYVKHPMEDSLKEKGQWEEFLKKHGLL